MWPLRVIEVLLFLVPLCKLSGPQLGPSVMFLDPGNRKFALKPSCFRKCCRRSLDIAHLSGACGETSPRRGEARTELHRPPVQGDALLVSPRHEVTIRTRSLIQRLVRSRGLSLIPFAKCRNPSSPAPPNPCVAPNTTYPRAKLGFNQTVSSSSSIAGLNRRDSM